MSIVVVVVVVDVVDDDGAACSNPIHHHDFALKHNTTVAVIPNDNREATTSFASMNATNLLKSLRIPLRGRILQTWVRGHCVFNLADKALMSESAVSVTSSFTGARRIKREENSINPGTYGRMIRANKGKTKIDK